MQATLLLIGSTNVAFASSASLVLANGDRISGNLLEFTTGRAVLETTYSSRIEIARAAVASIESVENVLVLLKSAERLFGSIRSQSDTHLLISSKTLGEHIVELADITSITPHTKNSEYAELDPMVSTGIVRLANESLVEMRGKAAERNNTTPRSGTVGRPEDTEDIRKLFLRQSSVLLAPKQYELEIGIEYQRSRFDALGRNTTSRVLSIPLGLRFGLSGRLQGYANLPVAFGQQGFSDARSETSIDSAGLGDISGGLNYQMVREGGGWPDLVASMAFLAPTGLSPYADDGSRAALGNGHWSTNIGLQFIKSEDPVVIFGGLNFTHDFARTGFGKRIQPGSAVGYNFGLSFAINDRVSLNGEFLGSAQVAMEADGARLIGTEIEPMQFSTGMIYRASNSWYLAPVVTYQLNSDAPEVVFGISTSHRIQ